MASRCADGPMWPYRLVMRTLVKGPKALTTDSMPFSRSAARRTAAGPLVLPPRPRSGALTAPAVARQLAAISADERRVLLGTGKYVGEGFDDARLDTLFVTLPRLVAGDHCPVRRTLAPTL
jgi:hypothetical protein